MPAKRIAAMGRSYRYPQADRRNCPPRLQRDSAASKTGRPLLQGTTRTGKLAICQLPHID